MDRTANAAVPDAPRPDNRPEIEPEEWVGRHGDYLFRHALARTGRQELAEDLVQETFLAAWKSIHGFAGRASEGAWLLGILRNKIADHYRRQQSEFAARDADALERLEEQCFSRGWLGGRLWSSRGAPSEWSDARQDLEQAEFWETLHACTHKLPKNVARVFLLRELDGMESPEVCRELDINSSHLFVLLHRARLALRRCLELHWFTDGTNHKRSPSHS